MLYWGYGQEMKLRNELNIQKKKPKILVIKLSSLAVTTMDGGVDEKKIRRIANDIKLIRETFSIKVVIVSSGAINAGRSKITESSLSPISYLQACSSVGQPILMSSYQKIFHKHHIEVAQVLLTHDDLRNKKRTLNVKSALLEIMNNNIIPIINENDSVSFDEITIGDNDQLSAMICELICADVLIMLTQSDGLYTKDPSDPESQRISFVSYKENMSHIETKTKTKTGRGGMKTKLIAVRKLTPLGTNVIVSSFNAKKPIVRSLTESEGSYFEGAPRITSKKALWIIPRVKTNTGIKLDKGAWEALKKNSSLLPVGIIGVIGSFTRGDSVSLLYKDEVIALGVSEYSSQEIEKIKGLKSNELLMKMSHAPSKVVVHKDNLILSKDIPS